MNMQTIKEDAIQVLRENKRLLLTFTLLAVIVTVLFQTVLMLCLIPSASMEGTLQVGDIVLATRYDARDIRRYDIMNFNPPDEPDTIFVKRVIGLPGETITIADGKVWADGMELDDSFLPEEMLRTRGDGVYQVPAGCYFMLGDNRNHSLDSRFWEDSFVPLENFLSKDRVTVFPLSRMGTLTYEG